MKLIAERYHAAPYRVAVAAPPRVSAADLGLLLLRITVGLLLAGHGAQKLFGLFGGPGLSGAGKSFAALGYRPGPVFAGLAGSSELIGGLGLAAGLLTPLAAAALIGVMINAMVVTAARGFWDTDRGFEYPMCIAVVALAIALTGPGRLSFDRIFPWRDGGFVAGAFALGVGGAGAAVILALSS